MDGPFLRFDYNLPAHRNEEREIRCHLHPGSDDILVPAPLMSPLEMLALFIDGLRWPEERKRRDATPFEVEWFQQMHASLQRGSTQGRPDAGIAVTMESIRIGDDRPVVIISPLCGGGSRHGDSTSNRGEPIYTGGEED
jgi:hypothetical protein